MFYRKSVAYCLSIHGCPVWPIVGIGAAEAALLFTNFDGDGGTFENCLDLPTMNQVIDATGGFSRLSDATFEFINSDSFSAFFGANRLDNASTYLTESLNYAATSATVADTSIFTDLDIVYLPRETIIVDSVDTGTEMAVSRSLYSAFVEGRASTYCAVPTNAIHGPDIALGGHWNHSGRWICLYRMEKDSLGVWSTPTRVYAGVISQFDYNGRKISLQTKSITSLFNAPIIQEAFFQLEKPTEIYVPSTLTITNVDGGTIAQVTTGTYADICEAIQTDANSRSAIAGNLFFHDVRPTFFWIQASGSTLPDESDCPSLEETYTSLALQKYLRLIESPAGSSGIGWNCSEQPGDYDHYDFFLISGSRFNFKQDIYNSSVHINSQYFYFENEDGEIKIIPCSYDSVNGYWEVSTDTADPWFDEDGNLLDVQKVFVGNSSTVKVKPVICLSTGTATDLFTLINQILISTGESIAPSENGELGFYQSLGIPYYLIDSDSFVPIGHYVKPVIHESKSLQEIFESCFKIVGYSIIFGSSGKVKVKQNGLAADGCEIGTYTLAQVATEKPGVAVGYQAPLTNITVKLKNLGVTYSYNMQDPQAAFSKGTELVLEDTISTWEYYYTPAVAYNNLYWLSNVLPSAVVSVDELIGEVGDVVKVSNKYILSGSDYGVTERLAIQTEVSTGGATNQVRFLLAGNLDLSSFAMLAPAARLDTAVGDKGLSADSLHFTTEFENGMTFVQFLYNYIGSTGPFVFNVRTTYEHTSIDNCYLDLNNGTIDVPAGYSWPAGFVLYYQDVDYYVTLGDYYLAED